MGSSNKSEEFQSPFVTNLKKVLPEWIDYNGHMNVAYYTLAFDDALDDFLDKIGIGEDYVTEFQNGPYALQANYHYLDELMVNEEFRVRIFLVGITEKCFHAAMEMFNENSGVVSAVCEQITMNVDLTLRKSNKYPDWVREKCDLMIKSQKGKPLPSQIGKSLALKS